MKWQVVGLLVLVAAGITGLFFGGTRTVLAQAAAGVGFDHVAAFVGQSDEKFLYDEVERHFSSLDDAYDIDVAEVYLTALARVNAQHPYLLHQQARIAFLRGDFDTALELINAQIEKHHDGVMSAFYMRGLIHGFRGDYKEASIDFQTFLEWDPQNWAALNDWLWVLLTNKEYARAERISNEALILFPTNPWLLTMHGVALVEQGRAKEAKPYLVKAGTFAQTLTEDDWLRAYPGNDPRTAAGGLAAMRGAIARNIHTLSLATRSLDEYIIK